MIDYSLSVSGDLINWVRGSLLKANTVVNDGDQLVITISAVNVLGHGDSCEIRKTIPTSK